MNARTRGYINGKLFITSDNIAKVKYALENEMLTNPDAVSAEYKMPNIIFGHYKLIHSKWVQQN